MRISIFDPEVLSFFGGSCEASVSIISDQKAEEGDRLEIVYGTQLLWEGVICSVFTLPLASKGYVIQASVASYPSSGADYAPAARAAHHIKSILEGAASDWERDQILRMAKLEELK
jgi:hypothetical protein